MASRKRRSAPLLETPKLEPHRLSPVLLERVVRVVVVGCGGNGSEIASGLPLLHQALLAQGHPAGLDVVLMDGDIVTPTNTVRQAFSHADVGHPKAVVLMNRLNAFYGLSWRAFPAHIGPNSPNGRFHADIVIGCVDTRRGRAAISDRIATETASVRDALEGTSIRYWLDLGNDAADGQFLLGMPHPGAMSPQRLPTVEELYPEMVDVAGDKHDDRPSCSARESLERQEPFVNRTLAAHALAMLARLFKYGEIEYHGAFVNLATGRTMPIPVSPEHWQRTIAANESTASQPAARRRKAS